MYPVPTQLICSITPILTIGYITFLRGNLGLDLGEGGVSIPDFVPAIRKIADEHPNATYVPGHGPLAKAADLRRFADYLEAVASQR